jgi:hypothetical protein
MHLGFQMIYFLIEIIFKLHIITGYYNNYIVVTYLWF